MKPPCHKRKSKGVPSYRCLCLYHEVKVIRRSLHIYTNCVYRRQKLFSNKKSCIYLEALTMSIQSGIPLTEQQLPSHKPHQRQPKMKTNQPINQSIKHRTAIHIHNSTVLCSNKNMIEIFIPIFPMGIEYQKNPKLLNNNIQSWTYLSSLQCRVHSLPGLYIPMLPSLSKKGAVLYQRVLWQTLMSGSSAGTLQAEGHSAKENESAIMTTKPPRMTTPYASIDFPYKKDQETTMILTLNTSLQDCRRVM